VGNKKPLVVYTASGFLWEEVSDRVLKSVIEAAEARQKQAKKRSLVN